MRFLTYPANASGSGRISKILAICVALRTSLVSLNSLLDSTGVSPAECELCTDTTNSLSSWSVGKSAGPQDNDISRLELELGQPPESGFWQDWTYWRYISDCRKFGYVVSAISLSTSVWTASKTLSSARPSITLRWASFFTSSGIANCDLTKNLLKQFSSHYYLQLHLWMFVRTIESVWPRGQLIFWLNSPFF